MGEKAWFEEEELLANGKKNLGNRILGWEKDGWGGGEVEREREDWGPAEPEGQE
jgi:hypothetical protein